MIDGHIHLENGELTKEYVLQFVEEAKKKGMKTIHILDHTHRFIEFEGIYESLKHIPIQKEWLSNKKMKFKDHLQTLIDLKNEVQELHLDIDVKFGLEVCFNEKYSDQIREILSLYKFDFVIGSIHSVNDILYDMTFSKELLFDQYDINEIYKRYYDSIIKLIESNLFDIVGHMDQIKLFNYYPHYDLNETYEKIALLCVKHHITVENNTGIYYRYHHKDKGLNEDLLNVLKKHSVNMITSSDAHKPHDVGEYIQDIYKKTCI